MQKIHLIVQRLITEFRAQFTIKYCKKKLVWSYNLDAHCKEYHPLDYGIVTKDNINHFKINDDEIKNMSKKI